MPPLCGCIATVYSDVIYKNLDVTCQTTVPPGDRLPTIKVKNRQMVKGLNNKTQAVHGQSDCLIEGISIQ